METSDETEWQERVVSHLGLSRWIRLEFEDELDCVGPFAKRVLARHGLLWPFNAHFHLPLLEQARGGSLLTGVGGDEMLSPSSWFRATTVLTGQVRPVPRDLLRVGFALAPRPLRRRVVRRRAPTGMLVWLRARARDLVFDRWAAEAASEPLRWRRHCEWWLNLRHVQIGTRSVDLLAADEDVLIRHPLASPAFVGAMAALPPRRRFAGRSAAMVSLFDRLLPEEILNRASKASFDRAFWSTHSRALVDRWQGEGVDTDLVDRDRLHALWTSSDPDPRSFTQLQAVLLAMEPAGDLGGDELAQQPPGLSQ